MRQRDSPKKLGEDGLLRTDEPLQRTICIYNSYYMQVLHSMPFQQSKFLYPLPACLSTVTNRLSTEASCVDRDTQGRLSGKIMDNSASQMLSEAAILLSAAYPETFVFWRTAAEEPLEIILLSHGEVMLLFFAGDGVLSTPRPLFLRCCLAVSEILPADGVPINH